MSVQDLISAIRAGDSTTIETEFNTEMMSRISDRMAEKREDYARSMFTSESVLEATKPQNPGQKVGDSHIHVSNAGPGKYKVHAVGKKFASGIKVGEHLTDTDLDDFAEMGGKVKNVHHTNEATATPKLHPDHIHVSDAGGGKYKVHKVGSNFASGIKPGEHLTDTDLDDFAEMGGKIKHVKSPG